MSKRIRRKVEDAARYVRVQCDVAYVELTQGRAAVIDAADADAVSKHLWCWDSTGYAVTNGPPPERKMVKMHRFLMKPDGLEVDYVNGNSLDNRRTNLRLCTRTQNRQNTRSLKLWLEKPVACIFKGVTIKLGRYVAEIQAAGRFHYLGRFDDPVEAAQAYDRAARKLHGEFARTNF